jgi:DNA-binding transcriptional ArsR family regulator
MMNEQPNYYAIIPAYIRYDSELVPKAILLYGEITALTNKKGYCWASDEYFAQLYNVSVRAVQKWLSSLEKGGYIHRDVQRKGERIVKRYIKLADGNEHMFNNIANESSGTYGTKVHEVSEQKFRENTTGNNTENNTNNKKQPKDKPLESDLENGFAEFWTLYPKKKNKGNKKTSFNKYKKAIKGGVKHEEIKSGLEGYIKHIKAEGKPNQFIKNAETFLNQEVWKDEYSDTGSAEEERLKSAYGDWNF